MCGALLLLGFGTEILRSNYSPRTIAFTHLITLGFVTMTLMGTVCFLCPTAKARGASRPWFERCVHPLFTIGVASFARAGRRASRAPSPVDLCRCDAPDSSAHLGLLPGSDRFTHNLGRSRGHASPRRRLDPDSHLLEDGSRQRHRAVAAVSLPRCHERTRIVDCDGGRSGLFAPGHRALFFFGWIAIWGWAGRIALESQTTLLRTQGAARSLFWLHLASIASGGIAIISDTDVWVRLTGLLIACIALVGGRVVQRAVAKPAAGTAV